ATRGTATAPASANWARAGSPTRRRNSRLRLIASAKPQAAGGVTMTESTDLIVLWRTIVQAGGIPAWVEAQLTARGLAVTRRETEGMAERDLDGYKKELKAAAE